MKVSETVTLVLTRGIWTAKRELTSIVTAASNINRKSKRGSGSHIGAETSAAAPQVMIEYLKKIAALAHPVVCITVSMIFPVTKLVSEGKWFRSCCETCSPPFHKRPQRGDSFHRWSGKLNPPG